MMTEKRNYLRFIKFGGDFDKKVYDKMTNVTRGYKDVFVFSPTFVNLVASSARAD